MGILDDLQKASTLGTFLNDKLASIDEAYTQERLNTMNLNDKVYALQELGVEIPQEEEDSSAGGDPGVTYVDTFDAVGDGVTDDTAAVLAAYEATPTNGVLRFSTAKTYLLSQPLVIDKAITLEGGGMHSTKLISKTSDLVRTSAALLDGLVVKNINLEINPTTETHYYLVSVGAGGLTNSKFSHVKFSKSHSWGGVLTNGSLGNGGTFTNNVFQHFEIVGGGPSIRNAFYIFSDKAAGSQGINNNRFSNFVVKNYNSTIFYLAENKANDVAVGNSFLNGLFIGCPYMNINLQSCRGSYISNCSTRHLEAPAFSSIRIGKAGGAKSSGITISNCTRLGSTGTKWDIELDTNTSEYITINDCFTLDANPYYINMNNNSSCEVRALGNAVTENLGAYSKSEVSGMTTFYDNYLIRTGTGGLKIAAAADKLGFWGITPAARPSGWGTPTGASSKLTFDPSSITLPVLAEHVAALINDLKTIGLLGS